MSNTTVSVGRTQMDISLRGSGPFALAVFVSAALIFLVEPMIAKMILPSLGGSPSVWNTCLAFFQIALLAGYLYAHLIQRIASMRVQVIVHASLLCAAALTLPLHISGVLGAPDAERPVLWLLGVLAVSLGAPFALLSATAPLLQAWFARSMPLDPVTGKSQEPYALYAASNAGSLIALLSYPLLVEPLATLSLQKMLWSGSFVAFILLLLAVGLPRRAASTVSAAVAVDEPSESAPVTWVQMAVWIGLSAIPSSLMMGVTTHITTDIATAPLLWVIPLALYLITFIIAFKSGRAWKTEKLLWPQAILLILSLLYLNFKIGGFLIGVFINLGAFFVSALIAHQVLASRRPDPRHLTLFYLCMSVGGVIGGSFNSFLAPVLFSSVLEYPLALVLVALARPGDGSSRSPFSLNAKERKILVIGGTQLVVLGAVYATGLLGAASIALIMVLSLIAILIAVLMHKRPVYFAGALSVLVILTGVTNQDGKLLAHERNFFGIVKIIDQDDASLGKVRVMAHGTTIHGGQALDPAKKCLPLTYYAPQTGLGQAVLNQQASHPGLNMAVVGLGAGTFATYTRPTDTLTYFEIDSSVVKYASDPQYFTFLSDCAKTKSAFVVGDARLKMETVPAGSIDLLVVDAFSSDSVPTHLLTVEAVGMYLSKLKEDGVVVFNLSNRHMELRDPVMAAVKANGAVGLSQNYLNTSDSVLTASSTIALVAAKNDQALAAYYADPSWKVRNIEVTPWSDNYVNLVGAFRLSKPQD